MTTWVPTRVVATDPGIRGGVDGGCEGGGEGGGGAGGGEGGGGVGGGEGGGGEGGGGTVNGSVTFLQLKPSFDCVTSTAADTHFSFTAAGAGDCVGSQHILHA